MKYNTCANVKQFHKRCQITAQNCICYKSSNKRIQVVEIATKVCIFFDQAGIGFKVYKPCRRRSVHAVTTGFKGLSSSPVSRLDISSKAFCKKDKEHFQTIECGKHLEIVSKA